MPENRDNVEQFEDLLNKLAGEEPGLAVSDLDMMTVVISIRLRTIFTAEQLHVRAHTLIAQTEEWLTEPGALIDEKGNPAIPILVENFEDKEDFAKMMRETSTTITDDDLSALLDKETE